CGCKGPGAREGPQGRGKRQAWGPPATQEQQGRAADARRRAIRRLLARPLAQDGQQVARVERAFRNGGETLEAAGASYDPKGGRSSTALRAGKADSYRAGSSVTRSTDVTQSGRYHLRRL